MKRILVLTVLSLALMASVPLSASASTNSKWACEGLAYMQNGRSEPVSSGSFNEPVPLTAKSAAKLFSTEVKDAVHGVRRVVVTCKKI